MVAEAAPSKEDFGTKHRDSHTLRVALIDDHPVVREGVCAVLAREPGILVVGMAVGQEAVEQIVRLAADVVLMDIRLSGTNGIDLIRRIKEARPDAAIIVLTSYDNQIYVAEALRAGASGYLINDAPAELICQAIKAVAAGETMVRADLLHRALQLPLRLPSPQPRQANGVGMAVGGLTAREQHVLRLIVEGKTNKEIATVLRLAEVTVKKHVQGITGKLGATSRTQAAVLALRAALVQ